MDCQIRLNQTPWANIFRRQHRRRPAKIVFWRNFRFVGKRFPEFSTEDAALSG